MRKPEDRSAFGLRSQSLSKKLVNCVLGQLQPQPPENEILLQLLSMWPTRSPPMLLAFQRPASFAGSRTSGEQSALHHKQTCPRISMPRKAKVRQFNGRRLCIFGRPREPQQFRLDPSSGEQPVMLLYGPHPLDLRRPLPVIGGLGGVERRASRHCCSSSHIVSFVETIQCRASARYCLPWAQLQKILFGCFCH